MALQTNQRAAGGPLAIKEVLGTVRERLTDRLVCGAPEKSFSSNSALGIQSQSLV